MGVFLFKEQSGHQVQIETLLDSVMILIKESRFLAVLKNQKKICDNDLKCDSLSALLVVLEQTVAQA